MIMVIAIVMVGALIGFLVRRKRALLRWINILTNVAIYALLLLLGISVGSNRAIILNLGSIGIKALALSVAAIAGSIAVGFAIRTVGFTEGAHEE